MRLSEKNVLFGNGIDIQFSENDDYKNYAIIQRMCDNLKEDGRYKEVFAGTVEASDTHDFMEGLNTWFKEHALKGIEALKLVANEDELLSLLDMSRRYKKTEPSLLNIGLEDYLLALKLFNATAGADALDYESLYQAITLLMLDSIYNNGKIENLYKNMECLKPELRKFKNIFTINYDRNVDKIVGHEIYHLHGSFDTLHHEYREDTLKGWAIKNSGKRLPQYVRGKEYLYSDAVFGFSGDDKMKRIKQYNQIYVEKIFEELRKNHPELYCPKYPIKEFQQISGELHIIGMGPNNDSHIFGMINSNPKLQKVIYYTACDDDTEMIKKVIHKPIDIIDVFQYWESIQKV